jgi:hypothetical protein
MVNLPPWEPLAENLSISHGDLRQTSIVPLARMCEASHEIAAEVAGRLESEEAILAIDGLVQVLKSRSGEPPITKALIDTLERVEETATRQEIITVLARNVDQSLVRDSLLPLVRSDDQTLRLAATKAVYGDMERQMEDAADAGIGVLHVLPDSADRERAAELLETIRSTLDYLLDLDLTDPVSLALETARAAVEELRGLIAAEGGFPTLREREVAKVRAQSLLQRVVGGVLYLGVGASAIVGGIADLDDAAENIQWALQAGAAAAQELDEEIVPLIEVDPDHFVQ